MREEIFWEYCEKPRTLAEQAAYEREHDRRMAEMLKESELKNKRYERLREMQLFGR